MLMLSEGRVKALYREGSVLVLGKSGSTFLTVSPAGKVTRQLSRFALASQGSAARLAEALDFRNKHVDEPYICKATLAASRNVPFLTNHLIQWVQWPASLKEGEQAGLVRHLASGSIQVRSSDLSTHLQLDSHRLRVTISCPLLVAAEHASRSYTYIQHTQYFPTSNVPSRWEPALCLAHAAAHVPTGSPCVLPQAEAATNDSPSEQQRADSSQQNACPSLVSPALYDHHKHPAVFLSKDSMAAHQNQGRQQADRGLHPAMLSTSMLGNENMASDIVHWPDPGSPPAHTNPEYPLLKDNDHIHNRTPAAAMRQACTEDARMQRLSTEMCSCTELPVSGSLRKDETESLSFAELSWWKSSSAIVSPSGPLIQLEQSSEALCHCLPHFGEVHAWVHQDGSTLVLKQKGRFCLHYLPGISEPRTYAIDAVPERSWHPDGHARLTIGPIARRAVLLWQTSQAHLGMNNAADHRNAAVRSSADDASSLLLQGMSSMTTWLSNEVVASEDLPGLGCFRALADGRVKASFADRTILSLDRARTTASLILPSGQPVQVCPASAHGLEQYMQPTLHFAARAWSTPEDRMRHAWQDACVASELQRTSAAAALCQTTLAVGIQQPGLSQEGDVSHHEQNGNRLDARGRHSASVNNAVCSAADANVPIIAWHPESQQASCSLSWDDESAGRTYQALAGGASLGRLSKSSAPVAVDDLSWDQLAGFPSSRTLFVDSWLIQNRALIARLQ
ncbi:hypothetical protein WJX74_000128 [Apatococcus lobatus]|uniref:Uncharacterized protein n=1 Tax=Apatococcus lobatus TaxID=904363 RepID=A0AAW1RGP7_9CHLO